MTDQLDRPAVSLSEASLNGAGCAGDDPFDLRSIVRPEEGLVGRKVFADAAIYERELERIFARCWLYLGHVSQIPNAGDYFTAYMGEDNVIVSRDDAGTVRAFLNSCRHRGMRVCRAESGNAKNFLCPYHGWSYGVNGHLAGVPKYEAGYRGELDRSRWGLYPVAQLEVFYGLIFATWDPATPPLREYLGEMAYYLELVAGRMPGGLEIFGGTHKWVLPCNWKIPTENFLGDSYHVGITHGSVVDIGIRRPQGEKGHTVSLPGGHGLQSEISGIVGGSAVQTGYTEFLDDIRTRLMAERGAGVERFVPVGTGGIFPNLSFVDAQRFRAFRVWQPHGPEETVVYSWCLVDREMPEDLKEATRKQYIMTFGPSGTFEQDDGEVWADMTAALRGRMTRKQDFNYQSARGKTGLVSDSYGADLPGTLSQYFSDENQRGFYRAWLNWMV